jgi:hypothetical protein
MNEEHHILVNTVAKSQGISEVRLRQLHFAAEKALDTTNTLVLTSRDGIAVSVLTPFGIKAVVAVATDLKTGWFLQLVSQEGKPVLMTIGRKFCLTGYDEVNKQTASKFF